jgi:beta-lactamase regulating signal transducer with metallopeptidase domain
MMTSTFLVVVLKASLVIAGAAVLNALVYRRASAAWRHLVWTFAVTALLLLPVLTMVMPAWVMPIHVAAATPSPAISAPTAPTAVVISPVSAPSTFRSAELNFGPTFDGTPAAVAQPATTSLSALRSVSWASVALVLYLAGVVVLTMRLMVERLAIRRIAGNSADVNDPEWVALLRECERAVGVDTPVRLLRSCDQSMPMTFGTRRPTVVIPSIADTWTSDRRRAVLLHELAHVARRDCFTQLLAAVTCAAYWIHPGTWWVARRLRIERELACDDRVLSVGAHARDYAQHLLELAYSLGGYRAPALVVSMARPKQLEGRMLAVLDAARNRATPALGGRMAGLAIAAALVVPLAAAETMLVPDTSLLVADHGATPSGDSTDDMAPQKRETRREIQLPGTWEIRPAKTSTEVYLQVHERPNNSHGFTIAVSQLEGLSPAMLTGSGGLAQFSIRRESGTINFEGTFRSGIGAGTYSFTPSATFPAELTKRGFERPTADDQYRLAVGNIGVAYLDELNAQKYARPDLDGLVRAADHGVSFDYLREMGQLGYRVGVLDSLIRMRDHGVAPDYVREMASHGMTGLSADELIRVRDHGVDPDYIAALKSFGYDALPLDGLVNARDHGINGEYIRGMRKAGFQLSLPELIRARDHGVNPEYMDAMASLGYKRLPIDELITARDHGVDAEYAQDLRDLGYSLTLDDLRNTRDHGVDVNYIRALNDLGYKKLPIEDLIRLRNHGVTPSFVKSRNSGNRSRLSVDELVRLRDRGGN